MDMRETGNTPTICKQCSSSIVRGDDCIACEGFCGKVYHIKCVSLSKDELKGYLKKSNFWWICDMCIQQIREIRNDRLPKKDANIQVNPRPDAVKEKLSNDDEILEMKKQIAAIQDTLRNVTFNETATEMQSLRSFNTDPPAAQSSPMTSPKLLCGTKNATNSNATVVPDVLDEKCWLFFTRLKNHVTEHDIAKMVEDSLGPNVSAVVKLLIPVWKHPSSMSYVSFKVGIKACFKQTALLPSTWPAGIYFREFHNHL